MISADNSLLNHKIDQELLKFSGILVTIDRRPNASHPSPSYRLVYRQRCIHGAVGCSTVPSDELQPLHPSASCDLRCVANHAKSLSKILIGSRIA